MSTAAAISAFVIQGSTAAAQDAGESAQNDGFGLDTIVVTARKLEENLQETPISIAAFDGEALDRRQIFSSEALDQATPNLSFSTNAPLAGNNASSAIFIRGVGQTDPLASVDAGVGVYIDEVYVGQSVGGNFDFLDIAQVEVLRGPQGTLFGRNTVGGAIVVSTVDPGDEFGGVARVGAGADDLVEAFAALDAPLSDALKTRVSFGLRKRDGYVRRDDGVDLGDENSFTVRGKAVWTPRDDFKLTLGVHYTEEDENGSPLVFAAYNENATFGRAASVAAGCPGASLDAPVPLIDDDRCANDFQDRGPFGAGGAFPLISTFESWSANAIASFDATDWLTLKSISAYRSVEWRGSRDADNTPLTILHTAIESDAEQYSQEIQAIAQFGRFDAVIGGFYFNENIDDIFRVEFTIPPGVNRVSNDNKFRNENWALFAQVNVDITERLSVTGGVRHTQETKGSIPFAFEQLNGPLPADPDPSTLFVANQRFNLDFQDTSFLAGAQYRFTDAAFGYFSYSEAFKGGGFNSRFVAAEPVDPAIGVRAPRPFLPEEVRAYEVGLKTELFDGGLRLNLAAFASRYDDLQFTFREGIAPFLANAGAASIEGLELEWTLAPTADLLIEGGVGLLFDADIDAIDALTSATTGAEVGNRLPFAPEATFNIGASYRFALGGGATLTPRIDYNYQSATFFDVENTPEIAQTDGYSLLNASVSLDMPNVDFETLIGISNLTDARYQTAGFSSLGTGSGYAETAFAPPRRWFIRVSKAF